MYFLLQRKSEVRAYPHLFHIKKKKMQTSVSPSPVPRKNKMNMAEDQQNGLGWRETVPSPGKEGTIVHRIKCIWETMLSHS